MTRYKNGDSMAFEVLYGRYSTNVYGYLSKRIFDKNIINDVFQNIFMKLHKSRNNYNSKYPFIKWLYTICRSEFIDYCKAKKLNYSELDEKAYSEKSEITGTLDVDIEHYDFLSSNEKEALKLKYYSDKDYSEISDAMKISESNARKIVSRGIFKLRKHLRGGSYE